MTLRRLLLVLLVAATACAAFGPTYFYDWTPDEDAPKCQSVMWKQIPKSSAKGMCGDATHAATEQTSCEMNCLVLSPFSEKQAKRIVMPDGDTLYDHEAVMHGQRGLKHQ